MEEPAESQPPRNLAARAAASGGLDTVDHCRMRLMALRTRIESNWPTAGGRFLRRVPGLSPESHAAIDGLLVALPTPLPLVAGGQPQAIISDTDTDLMAVAGRAVDACFALLDGATMETEYPGDVTLLGSRQPNALEPIVVSNPTVGLLVATIIGTLEAISETINAPPPTSIQAGPEQATAGAIAPHDAAAEAKRGRGVPRI
jgi:hypothetical protein